jgi:hypothetical protein
MANKLKEEARLAALRWDKTLSEAIAFGEQAAHLAEILKLTSSDVDAGYPSDEYKALLKVTADFQMGVDELKRFLPPEPIKQRRRRSK